ncbi:MAG TPA: glycosyltransferase family 87 protein [Candidatus Dormibacteraeota bacterium]|nr:glycosyltransferase family 87 protein [Candidatus Dormibacteraeota bacterium]
MKSALRLMPPVVLVIVLIALAIDFWRRSEPIGIDFHTYEAAARVGLQHGWSHLYDQPLVAIEQMRLVPGQYDQPFLSPPPVAWLAAVLAPLPYLTAFYIWAAVSFVALAMALAWSAPSRGLARWIAVVAALAPWWVLHAVHLGQVVPFVATGVVVAWRLIREERNIAAGAVLGLILLKPNTAVIVPLALLVAGLFRIFATWAAAVAVVGAVALLTIGTDGMSAYLSQLTGRLPGGAELALEGALGVSGTLAMGLRVIIVGAALIAAFKLRDSPGLVIAVGCIASLLVAPYLHGSDLCLLSVAAWIVWEERPALAWRAPLAVGWLVSGPFIVGGRFELGLRQWTLVELVFFAALVLAAVAATTWRLDRKPEGPAAPALG